MLLNRGNGGFAPPVSFAAGLYASALATGDFDADGRTDLALAGYAFGHGAANVLLNRCVP